MAQNYDKETRRYMDNKGHYESVVNIGKSLYVLMLDMHHLMDQKHFYIKEKLGMSNIKLKKAFNKDEVAALDRTNVYQYEKLDLSLLHKLNWHLCDLETKAPEVQKDFQALKEVRNDIAHITVISKFKDVFVWKKIEDLRILYKKIIDGIKEHWDSNLKETIEYHRTNIDDTTIEINKKIDEVLLGVNVEVKDVDLKPFLEDMKAVGTAPRKVKIEIKNTPRDTKEILFDILEWFSKADSKVAFIVNQAYFERLDQFEYNSEECLKFLLPALNPEVRSKLTWYRGTLGNELIPMLPPTLKQLYLRMLPDQVELLNSQLPKLPDLWSLGLFIDFRTEWYKEWNNFKLVTVDPLTLPLLEFKGKQYGLKIVGEIDVDQIPWVVEVVKRLTKQHQCDTLEFYKTMLNDGSEIEKLLRALYEADIHVTTWVKLQNTVEWTDYALEKQLNDFARKHSFKMFKFLRN
ncbi:unnamed protein product [Meganyctiphanes norvegica]|uniref:Swt1-like HEPN domain-containing protein n=1 Tax=Meganyctiphanes norvegica TaxID=48144 RepID=A0AAV2R008_MEGNR